MSVSYKVRERVSRSANREPVVIVGGFMSQPSDYIGWQQALTAPAYRRPGFIADINRSAWYLTRDGYYQWQIAALDKAVQRARQATGASKVWLLCHSAGGVVARLWMGEKAFGKNRCAGFEQVRGAIFLGTPHISNEPYAKRGMSFVNENYPGNYHGEIEYISAVGKSVYGSANGTLTQRIAYKSYALLNPQNPQQWGDGVVTLSAAHLPGANNFVLDNIYHVGFMGQPGYMNAAAMRVWGRGLLLEDQREAQSSSSVAVAS